MCHFLGIAIVIQSVFTLYLEFYVSVHSIHGLLKGSDLHVLDMQTNKTTKKTEEKHHELCGQLLFFRWTDKKLFPISHSTARTRLGQICNYTWQWNRLLEKCQSLCIKCEEEKKTKDMVEELCMKAIMRQYQSEWMSAVPLWRGSGRGIAADKILLILATLISVQ